MVGESNSVPPLPTSGRFDQHGAVHSHSRDEVRLLASPDARGPQRDLPAKHPEQRVAPLNDGARVAKSRPPRAVAISAGHDRIVRRVRIPSQVAWQGGRAGTPPSTPPNGALSTEEQKPFRERRQPGGNRVRAPMPAAAYQNRPSRRNE